MAATGKSPDFTAPVVLFIYRRPRLVAELLRSLRTARPGKIWIVADGPPAAAPGEERKLCLAARREAEEGIVWPCQVRRVYADENLGLRRRVETGLDQVFASEHEAIVLEEDCHPRPDFFPFIRALLSRYREEQRVAAISGNCFLPRRVSPETSYYFSRYLHVWGWATWARAWRDRPPGGSPWPRQGYEAWFPDSKPDEVKYWNRIFQRVEAGEIQSWAYPWMAAQWGRQRCFLSPSQNLVVNRGFGPDGTNTRDPLIGAGVERQDPLPPPYLGPEKIMPDPKLDRAVFENHLLRQAGRLSFWPRLGRSLLKRFGSLR